MVIEDLERLPASPLVVAEGSVLSPSAVSAGSVAPGRAIWLTPTREFQLAQLEARATPPGPGRLSTRLREVIEREAREHDAPILTVDGSASHADVAAAVKARFEHTLAAGPAARSSAERRLLLRETNEAVVHQVRGYYARPWAVGAAAGVRRDFVCECGDPICDVEVTVTVKEAARAPVLAPGHVATGG